MANKKVCVGDWISFYRDGKITISSVEYIIEKCYITEYCTHDGKVNDDYVLEVRGKENYAK